MSLDPGKQAALDASKGLQPSPSNLERVAAATSPEEARWAFSQWQLRDRARAKFSRADEMLFTRESLEQATHEDVATYRASRFPQGVEVVDLTCGIGGDLLALARRGPARGFELDPERAAYARHNLAVHGLEAEVLESDSLSAQLPDYALADPARRTDGKRTLDPADFSPPPDAVARHLVGCRIAAIKLSPLLPDAFLTSLGPGLEFVSYGHECREAVVWMGSDVEAGRFAMHVESGSILPAGQRAPATDEPEAWLFDPDPAAVRAHALGTLAGEHDLRALGDPGGYLTGSEDTQSPWLRGYAVVESGSFDPAKLKKRLEALDSAAPILKQRGAGLDLQELGKRLRLKGGQSLSVAFYRVGPSVRFAILRKPG